MRSSSLSRVLLVALLGTLLAGQAPGGESKVWLDDLDAALDVAGKERKDILVDFTGSDWCGWCKRLDSEVFSQEEFLDYAADKYVLVALDFPREDGEVWKAMTEERREANKVEAMRYQVQGFPTILLLSPDGVRYGTTGYQQGGAEAYAAHLEEMRTDAGERTRRQVQALRSPSAAADERLEAGYELFDGARDALREEILALVRAEDPDDSRGLLAEEELRVLLRDHLESEDPDLDAAAAALDALLERNARVDTVVQFHFARAWVAIGRGDVETVRRAKERLGQLEDAEPGMIEWLDERLADLEEQLQDDAQEDGQEDGQEDADG